MGGLIGMLLAAQPGTPVREGVGRFVRWYRGYYRV